MLRKMLWVQPTSNTVVKLQLLTRISLLRNGQNLYT